MASIYDYKFERLQDGQLAAYRDTTHHYRLTITIRHNPYGGDPALMEPRPWDLCHPDNWSNKVGPVEPKGGWQNDRDVVRTLKFFGGWSNTRDPWETKLDWIRKISPGVFEWHTREQYND